MNTFETINSEIYDLKINADTEQEMEIFNKLHEQFSKASSASWTREELEAELKQEDDVLDGVSADALFYEDVRSIQDSIVGFFGDNNFDA